jgi:uncharacterized membrane protein
MRRFALLLAGLALVAGVAATVSGGGTQAKTRWVITDLGTLGFKESWAVAINEHGQMIGWSATGEGDDDCHFQPAHAVLWTLKRG